MNSHEKYAALLDAFLDGELSEAEAEGVRAHLSECADCQAYVADALAIRDALPGIEETAVPDGFAESVLAALPPRRVSWRTHWAKIALPLAACAALAILLHGIAGRRVSDIAPGGGANTEESVTTDMDAGGEMPLLGNTSVADDADTAPEAALQSVQDTTAEETEPDMIPFAIRSSEAEVPEESEAEAVSNGSAAPAAKEVPDEAESASNASAAPAAQEAPDEAPATKELPGKDAATEKVPDGDTKTEAFYGGDTKTERVDGKEAFPDEVPPKPEPTLFGESGTKADTEFPEKSETVDFSAGAVSTWTLPAEALDLFDDYDPAEKTEAGIWYALTPEEFEALSQKLTKMELEIVSGADAPLSVARPGMEYVFVSL